MCSRDAASPRRLGVRAGFTVLEMVLALALLAVISFKVQAAFKAAQDAYDEDARRAEVESQARQVMRQIAFAVLGANRETLIPEEARPLSASSMRFQVHLGIQDGAVVWSDPERIALDEVQRQVFWSENPDTASEQRVVWSNLVTPFLGGEIPNGIDDNGNGLIDERGLSFEIDRDAVTIRLTLERVDDEGRPVSETVETTVTCRNLESS